MENSEVFYALKDVGVGGYSAEYLAGLLDFDNLEERAQGFIDRDRDSVIQYLRVCGDRLR